METLMEQEEKVTCDICLKEIPLSEAEIEHTLEYVRHFCGVDCYEEWVSSRHREELD